MKGGDFRPAGFNVSGAKRIITSTRYVETLPRSIPGSRKGGASQSHRDGIISGFITGNATGKGKYVGKSFITKPTSDVSATSDLADADGGTLAAAADCLILNWAEKGVSNTGHDVTAAANTAQFAIYFVGRVAYINNNGTKIVHVYIPWAGC